MNQAKTLTLIVSFLCLSTVVFSQSKAMKKANSAFDTGEYFKAAEMYEKLLEKASDAQEKAEISYKLGDCARNTNNPKDAKKWFKKAISKKNDNPLAVLYYADALKMLEDYENAKIEYQNYKNLVPDDSRGKNGIESCTMIQDWIKNPTRHMIVEMNDLNTKFSEFCPSYGSSSSEIYFTSSRESTKGTNTNNITGQNFSDIYFARLDRQGKWSVPVPVEGGVNTPFDEGASCVINNGSVMYYTSCKQEKKSGGCQIYRSKKSGEVWGDAELIKVVADSSISVGQPAVSADELTLYFVSDMAGGVGGKDIWKIERATSGSTWSKPINMGDKINTKGDEMFPYTKSNTEFYFSSNGLEGMGGLDLFKATKTKDSWEIENMKYPMNSSGDDFGIVFYENTKQGFFTTSRIKSDNIYSFELPDLIFTLKGIVVNSKTDEPLQGAKVTLTGSEGTNIETESASDGTFRFNLKSKTDYVIVAKKEKFLKSVVEESTKGITQSKNFEVKLDLGPIGGRFELPNIEYDVKKATLRPESQVSLDKLVEILNLNSNLTIELSSNTDYRGTDEANQTLSQARAQSVVDYLISKEIKADRLTAVGNGEKLPKVVDKKLAAKYDFLKENDILTEDFINKLTTPEQKDVCNQLNRRTEFRVLKDDYGINTVPFGED